MRLELITRIKQSLKEWRESGNSPSRTAFTDMAHDILEWKKNHGISGIWESQPLMLTATLDDAWGYGLDVIHLYAEAAGMQIIPLGLLQSPESIISRCQEHVPHILGMTILQFDSEEDTALIRKNIPSKTLIVAGGPLFRSDPELAERAGIDFVAKDAISFMEFLLEFNPS